MKIKGNNVYKIGSVLPVAFEVKGLSPAMDITQDEADMKVTYYTVDQHTGVRNSLKEVTLSFPNDDDKFKATDEFNVFATQVDTSTLDAGRLAGEVSFDVFDQLGGFPIRPKVPFLTDYLIEL